jgi:hypothetical protein
MEKKSIVINRIQEKIRVITLKDVIVNEDTHPELKGMTQEEMISYVKKNIENMKSIDPTYDNLEKEVNFSPIKMEDYHIVEDNIIVLPYEEKPDLSIIDDDNDEDEPPQETLEEKDWDIDDDYDDDSDDD